MTKTLLLLVPLSMMLLAAPSSFAQSCPYGIYGVWRISFSPDYLTHDATLKMNGCKGINPLPTHSC